MRNEYWVVGMMSGTSLDGVDLTFCHYYLSSGRWQYQLITAHTYPYTQQILNLIAIMTNKETSFLVYKQAQIQYSAFIAALIQQFRQDQHIDKVDFIAMHGHTIFHSPSEKITVQALNLNTVAANTGLNVIGNFRQLDVMKGGEGAPLAPYGEELFCTNICINFGGVANLGCGTKGWDITLCNLVLNHYALRINQQAFDKDGELGKQGQLQPSCMHFLESQLSNKGRQSLGRQQFEKLLAQIEVHLSEIQPIDVLTTYYHFLARQINTNVEIAITQQQIELPCRVLCTGGGAHNCFLMDLLRKYSQEGIHYTVPEKRVVDFKEAIIFGFLGVKYMLGIPNCSSGIGGMLVKGRDSKIEN